VDDTYLEVMGGKVLEQPGLKAESGHVTALAWTHGRIGMLSRREVLITAAAAGAAAVIRPWTTVPASASQLTTPVKFDVPTGACDCHVHVIGDIQRFPFSSSRTYTPEPASVEELRVLHRALHTDRVVVVNPSVYGTDNSCTLDALKQLGSIARAIVVIDDETPEAELNEMDRAGVRGIRINLETSGQADPAVARQRFKAAVERIKGRKNWHIQVYARLSVIEGIADLIDAAPMPVVFDHFGGAKAALGVAQPGFETLLKLLRSGMAYVKISGAYRSSTLRPEYPDVVPLAKALIAQNPKRILWGTDWPHPSQVPGRRTEISPLLQIDDGQLFNQLAVWAPGAATRATILVENPAKLYGF
jgi:predicted TIM-barrel fold metal-dependent hydrolase